MTAAKKDFLTITSTLTAAKKTLSTFLQQDGGPSFLQRYRQSTGLHPEAAQDLDASRVRSGALLKLFFNFVRRQLFFDTTF